MITKIILFIFIFACLFLVREGIKFFIAIKDGEKNMTLPRLFGIGAALSYIITTIITGFTL